MTSMSFLGGLCGGEHFEESFSVGGVEEGGIGGEGESGEEVIIDAYGLEDGDIEFLFVVDFGGDEGAHRFIGEEEFLYFDEFDEGGESGLLEVGFDEFAHFFGGEVFGVFLALDDEICLFLFFLIFQEEGDGTFGEVEVVEDIDLDAIGLVIHANAPESVEVRG